MVSREGDGEAMDYENGEFLYVERGVSGGGGGWDS